MHGEETSKSIGRRFVVKANLNKLYHINNNIQHNILIYYILLIVAIANARYIYIVTSNNIYIYAKQTRLYIIYI
jgi:hypothetical protein